MPRGSNFRYAAKVTKDAFKGNPLKSVPLENPLSHPKGSNPDPSVPPLAFRSISEQKLLNTSERGIATRSRSDEK